MTASARALGRRVVRRVAGAHRDERGASLPELLVGLVVSSLVMIGVTSAIFTTNDLRARADDRSTLAAGLALTSLALDRDGSMAPATAPAKSQTSSAGCTTPIDLGLVESGASVRFQAVAAGTDGPFWFQRVSGAGTRTLVRHVSSCSWLAVQEAGGDWTLRVALTVTTPSGESATQTLRASPRLW